MDTYFYDVQLNRMLLEGKIVRVKASTPEKARKRALAISRGDIDPQEGEYEGDWCDASQEGRVKVGRIDNMGK